MNIPTAFCRKVSLALCLILALVVDGWALPLTFSLSSPRDNLTWTEINEMIDGINTNYSASGGVDWSVDQGGSPLIHINNLPDLSSLYMPVWDFDYNDLINTPTGLTDWSVDQGGSPTIDPHNITGISAPEIEIVGEDVIFRRTDAGGNFGINLEPAGTIIISGATGVNDEAFRLDYMNYANAIVFQQIATTSTNKFLFDGGLGGVAQSADISPETNGSYVSWLSDGTGTGNDGDILLRITNSLGTTKTVTFYDFANNLIGFSGNWADLSGVPTWIRDWTQDQGAANIHQANVTGMQGDASHYLIFSSNELWGQMSNLNLMVDNGANDGGWLAIVDGFAGFNGTAKLSLSSDGLIAMSGSMTAGYKESLQFDLNGYNNKCVVTSPTDLTSIDFGSIALLSTSLFSGDYNDLTNRPVEQGSDNNYNLSITANSSTPAFTPTAGKAYLYPNSDLSWSYWNGSSWTALGAAAGSGDVVGPASAVNNGIARFDGTTGKLLKDGGTWVDAVEFVIDGGGSAITTGQKGHLVIPYGCTISKATIIADQSGSIVVDIWADSVAVPDNADSITASAPVTLSSQQLSIDSTLTGWTTAVSAGTLVAFNVDSASTVTRVTVALTVVR